MDKELIEIITNNSNLEAYFSLLGTQTKVRKIMVENLATQLKKEVEAKGRFMVTFSKNLGEKDSAVEFSFVSNPSEKIMLYWLSSWGVIAIGLHNGKKEKVEIRMLMANQLNKLRLGAYRDFDNWVWLMNIDYLEGSSQLSKDNWEYFNSSDLRDQVINWVNQIADTYREVVDKDSLIS
jgi:hypothetical protein